MASAKEVAGDVTTEAAEQSTTAIATDAAAVVAAAEPVELRKAGNDVYSTKQQDKAASGPDGIDQYELARTQVVKVAKSANPDNFQLRKEVVLGLNKSSTVFINYLAAAALDKTHEAGNKTMSALHVLAAFKEMGFPDDAVAHLRKEYNEKLKVETDKTNSKAAASAAKDKDGDEDAMEVDADDVPAAAETTEAGEESMAVGEETLAAADADNDDEDDEEEEAAADEDI